MAGADAVQVGTATFWDPRSPLRIAGELATFLKREKIARAFAVSEAEMLTSSAPMLTVAASLTRKSPSSPTSEATPPSSDFTSPCP